MTCKCGRASTQGECHKCRMARIVAEQDRRNKRARHESKRGHISDKLLFAGILIDT